MENITQPLLPSKKFLKAGKFFIYLLVFLMPLFFLPWTTNVLDFNKQALLLFLVFLGLICWLIDCFISNRLKIRIDFLSLVVFIFLLVCGISTFFSLFRYGSFWGLPLAISPAFLSLLGLAVLYFIITNLFKKEEILFLFLILFLSSFLGAVYFFLQAFGRFILPFDFTKDISFNTIGTVSSLAIYFSLLLILFLPLLFFANRSLKIIFGLGGILFLVALILINFKTAWLVFLSGLVVLFVFGVLNLKRTGRVGFITITMALLVIASVFLFFRFPLQGLPSFPVELNVSYRGCFNVLQHFSLKDLILGSGPGTFLYDWSKYKPLDVNQTAFWLVRFNRAGSEILDRLITTGLLGLLAFFFLVFAFFRKILLFLKENKETIQQPQNSLDWFLVWGIFSVFIATVFGFFFYSANFLTFFFFWFLLGCISLLRKEEGKIFDFSSSSTRALLFSFAFVLILIMGIGFFILYSQKYAAEVKYFQGLRAWQKGDIDRSIVFISQAASLNPQMTVFWRDLSQVYLAKINQVIADVGLSREAKSSQVQGLISSAINSLIQATTIEPHNAANWSIRGFVYRSMIGVLDGAEDWAIKTYQKASELEPNNPYILTEIGLSYLSKSDLLTKQGEKERAVENLKLARDNFDKAISLKVDYAPAHYQIAMIYIREEKIKEAITKLEEIKQISPFDTGLAFQLGLLYYNDNQFENARNQFERAVLIDPNYSNAHYFLGLIYDRDGKKNEAISHFEKIEQLNPDNQEVKKILANLRAGKPALEGVVPSEPPVEEKPPERLEGKK